MSQQEKTGGVVADTTGSVLAAVREALARSLVLPRDVLRDTLDDAVRRGRITREDAEELIDRLAGLGRQQTEDTLARIESAVAGPTRRAGRAVKNAPGTDRVLREVDRARRATGLGSAFPITAYDDLTAAQVAGRLDELSPAELRKVRDYERRNANRKSVLSAVEKRLA